MCAVMRHAFVLVLLFEGPLCFAPSGSICIESEDQLAMPPEPSRSMDGTKELSAVI